MVNQISINKRLIPKGIDFVYQKYYFVVGYFNYNKIEVSMTTDPKIIRGNLLFKIKNEYLNK